MSDEVCIAPPRAPRAHVEAFALHMLARAGGHAERAGARERALACEVALNLLTGQQVLPEGICDTWWRSAGHGSAQ